MLRVRAVARIAHRLSVRLLDEPARRSLPADEFLLFLCDHASGPGDARMRGLDIEVAKARLVELALRKRVALDGRERVVAIDPSPTGDPLLDPVIADLVCQPGPQPWDAAGEPAMAAQTHTSSGSNGPA